MNIEILPTYNPNSHQAYATIFKDRVVIDIRALHLNSPTGTGVITKSGQKFMLKDFIWKASPDMYVDPTLKAYLLLLGWNVHD